MVSDEMNHFQIMSMYHFPPKHKIPLKILQIPIGSPFLKEFSFYNSKGGMEQ